MQYTREQAVSFINIINSFQPFVPPVNFNALNGHPVVESITNVANGLDMEQAKKGVEELKNQENDA